MSSFSGLSLLRKKDKVEKPKMSADMAAYLAKQYGAAEEPKKRKKKKKSSSQLEAPGMRILDQDVDGFAPAALAAAGADDDEEEFLPVIANPEEAERLAARAEREQDLFLAKREDGSGWAVAEAGSPERGGLGRRSSLDAPPPRRAASSSPDASPPRRQHHASPDASPPKRRQRHDSPDASPPRRRQRHDSPDASPARRGQRSSSPDASPPRRPQRQGSEDMSPPRRAPLPADNDLSPPRKRAGDSPAEEDADAKRRRLMSDGTLAGMVSGRELQAEMQRKRAAEAARFAELDAHTTGREAATVYRDKEGKALSKEEFVEARAAERRSGKAQYDDESHLAWGGGLAQQAEREEAAERMRAEAAKPFARGLDAEVDAEQRDRLRWGDPMAHLVKRRQPEVDAPASLVATQQDRLKKSGFVIPLETPLHSWLRRGVGAPPNRYNIKPGRHWDGVDRSNGFEGDMFKRQTELRRREQEAHMWAQGDM